MKKQRRRLDPNTVVLLKQIGIGLLALSVVALLITAIWHGTRLAGVTINKIVVEGGETVDHGVVTAVAEDALNGEYLGLIPKRFAWLYPKTALIEALDQLDRVHNVVVERVSGTEINIAFDEYVPRALWCASVQGDKCLFLDKEGYAFAEAPTLSGGSFVRFVISGTEPQLDTVVASGTSAQPFETSLTLVTLLADQSWHVSHVELDQVGDAFLKVVDGGEFKVSLNDDPTKTVENLLVVLASEEFAHLAPGNFQYIDLRFGNKVFVNEEIAAPEEEAAIDSDVGTSSKSEDLLR